jgi:hypothetical protein
MTRVKEESYKRLLEGWLDVYDRMPADVDRYSWMRKFLWLYDQSARAIGRPVVVREEETSPPSGECPSAE